MNDVYRVVCSENPRLYPGKTFIDIYPAGSSRPENCLNHDCILMMRQVINPEVYSLESGILLHDKEGREPYLQYETTFNKRLKLYQDNFRKNYDKKILETFQKMKSLGRDKTMDVSFLDLAVRYDFFKSDYLTDTPKSAREQEIIQSAQEHNIREQKRQELIARKQNELENYRKRKNLSKAPTPEQMLAWKQAHILGD